MKTAFPIAFATFCLIATSLTANTYGQAQALNLGSLNHRVESGVSQSWYQERSNPNQIWIDSRIFNRAMQNGAFFTYWYPASNGKQYCEFRRILRSTGTSSQIHGQMHMLVTLSSRTETGYYSVPTSGGHGGGTGGGQIASPNIAGQYTDTSGGAIITVTKTGHNRYSYNATNGYYGTLVWNGTSIQGSDAFHANGNRIKGSPSKNIQFSGNTPKTIKWANGYTWARR